MGTIREALGSAVGELSDENYARFLPFYRFWLDAGQHYVQIPPDAIFGAIWDGRVVSSIVPERGQIFHSSAHLLLHFAEDAESDSILAPYSSKLQSRLCARSLREFSTNNLIAAHRYDRNTSAAFYADANLIAHWTNLGYVEEATIRNYILQSLISHPTLHPHQAHALIILFKLAGPTFEAYVDPLLVDRCFELLQIHSRSYRPDFGRYCGKEATLKCNIQVRVSRDKSHLSD